VRQVDVDGLRLRVATRGTGRPLLLLMGIGGNLEMWAPFAVALRETGARLVAADRIPTQALIASMQQEGE
jgi:pimeloyl-ACP methyl ester carboxylesterase